MTKTFLLKGNTMPSKKDLSGAVFPLLVLPITYKFHPIKLVDGILGTRETNARLSFDDVLHISRECLSSNTPFLIPTDYYNTAWSKPNFSSQRNSHLTHYAAIIEWMEAAEMYV